MEGVVTTELEMIVKMHDVWAAKRPLGEVVMACSRIGLQGRPLMEQYGVLMGRMSQLLFDLEDGERAVRELQGSCVRDDVLRRLCERRSNQYLRGREKPEKVECLAAVLRAIAREGTDAALTRLAERAVHEGAPDHAVVGAIEAVTHEARRFRDGLDELEEVAGI